MSETGSSKSFTVKSEHAFFDWPGGKGIDVALVRVVLSDLALYFNAPMYLDGNTVAIVLAVPNVGPLTIAQESLISEMSGSLTASEVDQFCYSYMEFNLLIGRTADLDAAKSFVRRRFPSWADVYFLDETFSPPPLMAYQGPSSGGDDSADM